MIKHVQFENTFTKRLQFKDHLKSPSLVKHGTIIDSDLAMSTRSTRSTLKTQTNRCQHLSNRGLFIFGKSKWVLISEIPLSTLSLWLNLLPCLQVCGKVRTQNWSLSLVPGPDRSPASPHGIMRFLSGCPCCPTLRQLRSQVTCQTLVKSFTMFSGVRNQIKSLELRVNFPSCWF